MLFGWCRRCQNIARLRLGLGCAMSAAASPAAVHNSGNILARVCWRQTSPRTPLVPPLLQRASFVIHLTRDCNLPWTDGHPLDGANVAQTNCCQFGLAMSDSRR